MHHVKPGAVPNKNNLLKRHDCEHKFGFFLQGFTEAGNLDDRWPSNAFFEV